VPQRRESHRVECNLSQTGSSSWFLVRKRRNIAWLFTSLRSASTLPHGHVSNSLLRIPRTLVPHPLHIHPSLSTSSSPTSHGSAFPSAAHPLHAWPCAPPLGPRLVFLRKQYYVPKLESCGTDNNAPVQQLIQRKDFKAKCIFFGMVHCEASLVALVHSFPSIGLSQETVDPFSKQATEELTVVFSVSICVTEHTCH
jgi:hypothetical protein